MAFRVLVCREIAYRLILPHVVMIIIVTAL